MWLQQPTTPAHQFRTWSRVCGIITVAIGLSVLLGWIWDVTTLKRVLPDLQDMSPATAACFMLGGCALLVEQKAAGRFRAGRCVTLAGVVMAFTGIALVLQHPRLLGEAPGHSVWEDSLRLFLTSENHKLDASTGATLLLLGAAIALRDGWARQSYWPAHSLFIIVSGFAMTAGLCYLYGARHQGDFGIYVVPMAVHTAAAFVLMGLGWLFVHPERGLMVPVSNKGASGIVTRRLLLGGFLIPLLLGWLTLQGQNAGWYPPLLGVVFFAVQTTFCLMVLILWTCLVLRHLEVERARHAALLAQSETRFRMLAESAFEGIMVVRGNRIVDANWRFCQMVGWPLEDIKGCEVHAIFQPGESEGPNWLHAQALHGLGRGAPRAGTALHFL